MRWETWYVYVFQCTAQFIWDVTQSEIWKYIQHNSASLTYKYMFLLISGIPIDNRYLAVSTLNLTIIPFMHVYYDNSQGVVLQITLHKFTNICLPYGFLYSREYYLTSHLDVRVYFEIIYPLCFLYAIIVLP